MQAENNVLLPVSAKMARDWSGKPCPYCGKAMDAEEPGREPTWDHICPSSRGGSNQACNKIAACRTCNFDKSDCLPTEWLKFLRLRKDKRAEHVAKFIFERYPNQITEAA
jgi:5-methylcytosine-specific restriction endonuclease McrA